MITFQRTFLLQIQWSPDEHDCVNKPGEWDTCEQCEVWDLKTNRIVASLGCIDDADTDYRQDVEQRLLIEAIHYFYGNRP
jgi:hypothetical protein